MASIGLSSQESESNRFHHLLRPYRELADDWNIDLAEDLIEYIRKELEEYEEASAVNFAQAAVLVQNSAMVYTKKVESLYDMIIKTLENLSRNQLNSVSGRSERKPAKSAAQEGEDDNDDDDYDSDEYKEEDDFRVLPIPDVEPIDFAMLQPQKNFGVVSSTVAPSIQIELLSQVKSQVSMCRSTLIDIRTGALLLESDRTDQSTPSVNLVVVEGVAEPSSSEAVQPTEMANTTMDESFDNGGGDDGPDYYGDDYHPGDQIAEGEEVPGATAGIQTDRDGRKVSAPATWDDFLDPNVPCKIRKDKPFKKGKCHVNPSDEKLNRLSLVPESKEDDDEIDIPQIPLLAMIADSSKIRTAKDVGMTGLAFVEFEFIRKMYDRQMRKQGKRVLRDEAQEQAEEEKEREEEAYDEDYEEDEYYGDGNTLRPPPAMNGTEANAAKQDDFILPESAMNSTSESYADLVRSHVSRFLEDARNWASESKLSLRVRGWHDYLEPILYEQESRPAFDLREYETILVNELQEEQETNIPFETLVDKAEALKMVDEPTWDPLYQLGNNQSMSMSNIADSAQKKIIPRWQVCRMFLTALELANQGSVTIDDRFGNACDTEFEFENRKTENFKLTYLKPLRFASGKTKKKMMRVSAGGKENQVEDRENIPMKY